MNNRDQLPSPEFDTENWEPILTKRDRFALAAMQGYLAQRGTWDDEMLANCSVRAADALLIALED